MKSLIIGAGQVGTALFEVLKPYYDISIRDLEDIEIDGVNVLHICYPDHDGFEQTTKAYIRKYKPSLTIIHSSVQVGTTAKCGEDVVYSPTRGRHPRLAQEMKSFEKVVGSKNRRKAEEAADYFLGCGWIPLVFNSPESPEFLKVFSNVHMGLEIAWRQEAQRMMKALGINDNDYEIWERTYRDGCLDVKDFNLVRPLMNPGPIGGHCILPCLDILRKRFESSILDFIVESNEKVKNESLVAS